MFISSKIQFSESKSQLVSVSEFSKRSCLSVQRYNFLKANHNYSIHVCNRRVVVYQFKDTIFWKQITTRTNKNITIMTLFISSKIQFSESKSQPIPLATIWLWSCLSVQRYNFLKANHNPGVKVWSVAGLFISSKIQFSESKSQLKTPKSFWYVCCLSVQRYNFLKANHNRLFIRGD